jgi:hypothetical protein
LQHQLEALLVKVAQQVAHAQLLVRRHHVDVQLLAGKGGDATDALVATIQPVAKKSQQLLLVRAHHCPT